MNFKRLTASSRYGNDAPPPPFDVHRDDSKTLPPSCDDSSDSDLIREAAQQSQERALVPLVEDVAEWLTKVTGVTVESGEGFMDCLDNGVILCQLISQIQDKQSNPLKEKIKYKQAAGRGSWHARDNAATFIMWCKHFGVKSEVLFESDGLVSQKQKREVVLCLLELSRFSARYGIDPPAIIKLEKDIEQDEKMLTRMDMTKVGINKKINVSNSKPNVKLADIDQEVLEMTSKCECTPNFHVSKLTDGIYAMGNKRCLIRRFKGRHIMVRVGGGWDTLDNYLLSHDPCRVALFRKAGVLLTFSVLSQRMELWWREDINLLMRQTRKDLSM